MGLLGDIADVATGGVYSALGGSGGLYDDLTGGGGNPPASTPPAADNSDALLVSAENNKTVAEGQIMTQEFSLQQASMDRELKRTADLELSLETFDTKLQTGLLEFKQSITAEENRHVEKRASDSDIPPPSS